MAVPLFSLNVQDKLLFGDIYDVLSDNTTDEMKFHFAFCSTADGYFRPKTPKTGRYFVPGRYCGTFVERSDCVILHRDDVDPRKAEEYFCNVDYAKDTDCENLISKYNWKIIVNEDTAPPYDMVGLHMVRDTHSKLWNAIGQFYDLHTYIVKDPKPLSSVRYECLRIFDSVTKEEVVSDLETDKYVRNVSPLRRSKHRVFYLADQEFGDLREENIFGVVMSRRYDRALVLEDSSLGPFGMVFFTRSHESSSTADPPPKTVNMDELMYD